MKEEIAVKDVIKFDNNKWYWLHGHYVNWIREPGKGTYDDRQYYMIYERDDYCFTKTTGYELITVEDIPSIEEIKQRILNIINAIPDDEIIDEYISLADCYPNLNKRLNNVG